MPIDISVFCTKRDKFRCILIGFHVYQFSFVYCVHTPRSMGFGELHYTERLKLGHHSKNVHIQKLGFANLTIL